MGVESKISIGKLLLRWEIQSIDCEIFDDQ